MSYTDDHWTLNPWKDNPWTDNPWTNISVLEFTNTGASLDPYIEVTGSPEILWTWSDGSTSDVANPGAKSLTGTHTLLVTPWSAVTRFDFDARNLTGTFITQTWEGMEHLYLTTNSFSGDFTTYAWPNLVQIYLTTNSFSGDFTTYAWPNLTTLYGNVNSFSGSFITHAWPNLTGLYLDSNSYTGGFTTYPWANLVRLYLYNNSFTGDFAVQAWVNMDRLRIHGNSFTSISGSLQTQIKMTSCLLSTNAITSQAEIDKVFADLKINSDDAGRSAACTVNTSGGTNAAPSAQGQADAAYLVSAHSWTVTYN